MFARQPVERHLNTCQCFHGDIHVNRRELDCETNPADTLGRNQRCAAAENGS
jgi:hypothetical protein